jgi:hypothetical protein
VFQLLNKSVPNCSKCYEKTVKKRPKSVPNCSTLKYIGATNQHFITVNNFYTLYIFWNSNATPPGMSDQVFCFFFLAAGNNTLFKIRR